GTVAERRIIFAFALHDSVHQRFRDLVQLRVMRDPRADRLPVFGPRRLNGRIGGLRQEIPRIPAGAAPEREGGGENRSDGCFDARLFHSLSFAVEKGPNSGAGTLAFMLFRRTNRTPIPPSERNA